MVSLAANAATSETTQEAHTLSAQKRVLDLFKSAGLFGAQFSEATDQAIGDVLAAKRINRLLWADRSNEGLSPELLQQAKDEQQANRALIRATPYEELVATDKLNDMLIKYVDFLIKRSNEKLNRLQAGKLEGVDENDPASLFRLIKKESDTLKALKGERQTYEKGSDYARNMFRRIEKLVKLERYMPLARLGVESGLIKDAPTPEYAKDLASNVLSVDAALCTARFHDTFNCVKNLDPVRSKVVAMAERQMTRPLSAIVEFEKQDVNLDRINALRILFSAQLHEAFSKNNSIEELVSLEKDAKQAAKQYAQVTMALAHHYLENGPATEDSRMQNLRAEFKAQMEKSGVFDKNADGSLAIPDFKKAIAQAQELAQASAADLATVTKNDAKLNTMLKTLTDAVNQMDAPRPLISRVESPKSHEQRVNESPWAGKSIA